ncbi:MAG: hypothetical protein ACC662_01040, partial [Planctomycetota bacterium]
MTLDRARGEIEARGGVRAEVYVADASDRPAGMASLGITEPQVGAPVTFGVATNGRIEIRGLLAQETRKLQPDADQIVRIEGGVVAEVVAASTAIDRLRAQDLEVTLRRSRPLPTSSPTAPLARMAPRGSPSVEATPARGDTPRADPIPWGLEAEILTARLGRAGFETLEALDGARLTSKGTTIQGGRIAYDGHRMEVTVRGEKGAPGRASFGPAKQRNEIWSPQILLHLDKGGPRQVDAEAPTQAVLIRRSKDDPNLLERFTVTCSQPVRVTPSRLTTEGDGLVEIQRHIRVAPGAAWSQPAHLWANRLVVEGRDLLSGKRPDVETVTASGPRTVLQVGEGSSRTTVWGYRFQIDVAPALATLTGTPAYELRIRRGPDDQPRMVSRQKRIVVDLKTGMPRNWDQVQFILRGTK